MTFLITTWQLD